MALLAFLNKGPRVMLRPGGVVPVGRPDQPPAGYAWVYDAEGHRVYDGEGRPVYAPMET